ncbi:MAG TPA: Ppx/GppA phosphatase family protein [Rhizomicrobium sp.]|nr:Ppx/GppA phosphatase family protein [Rhizomicrobium sp.]
MRPSGRAYRQKELARGGANKASPLLAVLDLGSNNCRLLIARAVRENEFRIVDSFSRIVRLGEGVAASGRLSEAALARTMAALKICAEHIGEQRVTHTRAIATAAARAASNSAELIARARDEAGIVLEIVSEEEEARLAAIGCAPLVGRGYEGALVFDIGGGSTEIIWMRRESGEMKTVFSSSTPVGVVNLAEDVATVAMDSASFDAMRARLIARFAPVREKMDGVRAFSREAHHLLGTSGTVTTLAAVAMGLDRYVRSKVDASWHDCTDILKVVDELIALDHAGRAAIGGIGPDRADLVLPGCAIFAAIHALWPCEKLRVADRGLREGMLRELMLQARA